MEPKAVIFDLDGTLLDTLADIAAAANAVLQRRGFPAHDVELYRYFVGDGLEVLMQRILPADATASLVQECCADFADIYRNCWDKTSGPYPGITTMLSELHRNGLQLAVLSNKPHAFTTIYIDRFFPETEFAMVLGQRAGVPKKPDPAGAIEIAASLAVAPAECVYVGDTSVDMQTGNRAGMSTVGVLWGFRDLAELQENNAGRIVTTPQEIVDYVLSFS